MSKRERDNLLRKAYALLDEAYGVLEELAGEENDSLSAWPDSLQGTERYETAETRAGAIDDLFSSVEELRDNAENILNGDF